MEVAVEDAATLSYEVFCELYMSKNRPVRIKNVTKDWTCHSKWRTHDGLPDYKHLREKFGEEIVPIADGDLVEYGAESRSSKCLSEYIDLIESHSAGLRYLKDWNFAQCCKTKQVPELYSTPVYFSDDWLNWWRDRKQDKDGRSADYRFLYFGPAGSWTPMHHDVLCSFSWSVNIVGCKKWILFSPEDTKNLYDKYHRQIIPDITAKNIDKVLFPYLDHAQQIHVVQGENEAIFVPSGWYHQVCNVSDTISINHNWFNAYNIPLVWKFLQSEHEAVATELEHLKGTDGGWSQFEFLSQCQKILQLNAGMNYIEFHALLRVKEGEIVKKNADFLDRHLPQLCQVSMEIEDHLAHFVCD